MVAMDFANRIRGDMVFEEFTSARDAKPDVREAPLIGTARGVPDDERENIDSQVIYPLTPKSAADQETSISTAQIDDYGCVAAEKLLPVQMSFGKFLEGCLCPAGFVQNVSREGNSEFAFSFWSVRLGHD